MQSQLDIETSVRTVEKLVKLNSSDAKSENMSNILLKKAAKMFIYLNSCFTDLRPWFVFYTNLFDGNNPNMIMLQLNRILKSKNASQNQNLKNIARELFEKTSDMFSLKHRDIKSIIDGQGSVSWQGDMQHLRGEIYKC